MEMYSIHSKKKNESNKIVIQQWYSVLQKKGKVNALTFQISIEGRFSTSFTCTMPKIR